MGERHAIERPGTYDRPRHLREHAGELRDPDQNARALAMLGHAPDAPVRAHPDLTRPLHQRWETLATIGLDLPAGHLRVHRGGPCRVAEATWRTS